MIPRRPRTKSKLKKRIICRKCFTVFQNESTKNLTSCPNCKRVIDARIRTEQSKVYNLKHPDRVKKYKQYDKEYKRERGKTGRERVRMVVLNILSGNNPKCIRCGCNDKRFLEINHKNGGGGKEMAKGKRSNQFYWDIYMGRRTVDDLELLCKPCNAIHALELKHGKVKLKVLCIE